MRTFQIWFLATGVILGSSFLVGGLVEIGIGIWHLPHYWNIYAIVLYLASLGGGIVAVLSRKV